MPAGASALMSQRRFSNSATSLKTTPPGSPGSSSSSLFAPAGASHGPITAPGSLREPAPAASTVAAK